MKIRDTIFQEARTAEVPFSFNEEVTEAFDDMAKRSIPGYLHSQLAALWAANNFISRGSKVYDLGASTGETAHTIEATISTQGAQLVCVDASPHMCKRLRDRFEGMPHIEIVENNLSDITIESASLIISFYTLQFIKTDLRPNIVQNWRTALVDSGALLLAEKISLGDPKMQKHFDARYREFKLSNGYSPKEIENKALALNGVLQPSTNEENIELLINSGFSTVHIMHQELQFVLYLALP